MTDASISSIKWKLTEIRARTLTNSTQMMSQLHVKATGMISLLWAGQISLTLTRGSPEAWPYSAINNVRCQWAAAQCEETGRTWQTDALAARWPCNPEPEPQRCCPAVTATERKLLLSIKTNVWMRTRDGAHRYGKISNKWLLSHWRDSGLVHDSLGFYSAECRKSRFTSRVYRIYNFSFIRLYRNRL